MKTNRSFAFSVMFVAVAAAIQMQPTRVNAQSAPATETAPAAAPKAKTKNKAIIPVPRPRRENWMKRHEEFNQRAKQGDIDLVFIGDSITEAWDDAGKEVWAKYYGSRKVVNFGFSGDRTEHILWRIDHGNLDGINPKLVVLMIGTNNWQDNTASEIADGITAVVGRIREKVPGSKILLMGILPRDDHREETRGKFAEINKTIGKLADGKSIYFLDMTAKLLKPDGSLDTVAIPDLVHFEAPGFQMWAEAIEPQVVEWVDKNKQ